MDCTEGIFDLAAVRALTLGRYRLEFEGPGIDALPGYAGSAWRGALGHALRRIVCVTGLPACPPCLLYRSCPYPYLFETPLPLGAQKMRRYTVAPHPFLLEMPAGAPTQPYGLGLTLIGRGNQYLAYFIHAFGRAGARGLGMKRAPVTLTEVLQADPPEADQWVSVYKSGGTLEPRPARAPEVPVAGRVRICLQTPLRLQREEHLVHPDTFRFSDLFGALLRRVSMLTYFHTDTPLETEFAALMERARQIELVSVRLYWKDWTRYSSRQQTAMELGGLLGEIEVDLSDDAALWPYVWLGQWIHAGKGTSMGLGQYRLEIASLPEIGTGGV